jgi:hypothetical protein
MTSYKIGRDSNGNKVLRVKPSKGRGFSIQTLGNLPLTHKMDVGTWTDGEVKRYVAAYGTVAQRKALFMETEEEAQLKAYRRLHEIISDCVERGVISSRTAPDDYCAIATALNECCIADPDEGGAL